MIFEKMRDRWLRSWTLHSDRKTLRVAIASALIVIALGVLTSYVLASSTSNERQRSRDEFADQQYAKITNHIDSKLIVYENSLIALAATLSRGADVVTRSEWTKIYTDFRFEKRNPEILGVAYADYIKPENLQTYIDTMRAQGMPNYTITPSGPRDEYTAIKFLEPNSLSNQKAYGFDMFSEPTRRAAMSAARDSGNTALTKPVLSVQDADRPDGRQPLSLLMYYPIYSADVRNASVEDRRANLNGYVYLIFRVEDMLASGEDTWKNELASLTVSDISAGQDNSTTLYDKSFLPTINTSVYQASYDWRSGERLWQVRFATVPPAERLGSITPASMFLFGLITSLMIGLIVFLLLTRRAYALHQAYSDEVQRSKNDLLALASHQLRTPATGVRQYINMLIQEYFGPLNKAQLDVAEKAYNSNERQLEIIDQLLCVAKLEAGQLIMNLKPANIADTLRSSIDTLRSEASKKAIKITLQSRKSIVADVDERYIAMIFDNLLSNAIKYSFPKSNVRVQAQVADGMAVISIRDHGVGIPESELPHLFRKFSRINNPLSQTEGGSGLGLFLAYKLAEAHHARLYVISVEGRGSTFTLSLPLKSTHDENVARFTEALRFRPYSRTHNTPKEGTA